MLLCYRLLFTDQTSETLTGQATFDKCMHSFGSIISLWMPGTSASREKTTTKSPRWPFADNDRHK